MGLRTTIAKLIAGKPKTGHDALVSVPPRSSKWPVFRKEWLRTHPFCVACGNTKLSDVQVHHLRPLHHGGAELSDDNLVTLCEDGPANTNCHALIGHCGKWADWNQNCERDAARLRQMLNDRVVG